LNVSQGRGLLDELTRRGATLVPEGNHVRYRAPKGALTPELRAALAAHKQEVLALLRAGLAASRTAHPLSSAQQAIWLVQQAAPDTVAYNIAAAYRIRSRVDVAALEHALQALADRHATLRTTYGVEDSIPVQYVHGATAVELERVDASAVSWDELRERIDARHRRAFDLVHGPVIRPTLFTRAEDDHVLLLGVHHLAADGAALKVLHDELRALYAAHADGSASTLPLPTCEYSDYVRWHRELLDGEDGDRLWRYWRDQLAGELPVLALPTDRPRPRVPRYRGASQPLIVSAELTRGLKAFARAEGTTLFTTLLAVFQVLLHRYSGQSDIVVGSPTFARGRADYRSLVGHFVNMVPLRVDGSGQPSFRSLVGRTRGVVLGALEHHDYPFQRLLERLQPTRDPGLSPIFQVVFSLLHGADDRGSVVEGGAGAGLRLEPLRVEQQEGAFDLTLELTDTGGTLEGALKYNTDLFDAATVARMSGHLERLIEQVVADPDQSIERLELLTAAERQVLLVDWNETSAARRPHTCVHELFEAQAARTPDALAVTSDAGELSYRELDRRANQIAHRLRRMGIGPDVPVGVYLERSPDLVAAIVGILKAGGAYVPIDPAYPPDRLAFMVEDAGMPVLLTQASLAPRVRAGATHVLPIDADRAALALEPESNPSLETTADNLAYVIYTSGSTGTPKGVAVQHDGLVNLVTWHQRAYTVTAGDRATLVAGLGFDASVWELWPYLTAGASLHLPDERTRVSVPELLAWMAAKRITVCFLSTPLLEAALELSWPADIALRAVLTGGDQLHRAPRHELPCALVNHYGPTENTVVTTCGTVTPGSAGPPTIGRPIANTQVFVLDPYLNPVPVGVPGELYIGGIGLARGYLNRPELTADRFVVCSIADLPPMRLYRTGDLARFRSNGEIDFLGRIDNQVKLRGFRIELGEIEAVLCQHPMVREAAVLAREDSPGRKQLVGYVVPAAGAQPTARELRESLRAKLPDYMVPAAFVSLAALPLTPNGKVDRRALPEPHGASPEDPEATALPTTETETLLARITAEVLGLHAVGIRGNFFDLGGHSLLATRLMARIRGAFGVELPVRTIFDAPTVAELAQVIDDSLAGIRARQVGGTADREEIEI
jgi:amino acid adenylation domain-containing protein